MKKLALDYGEVRIGLALSDIMSFMATGLDTYKRKTEEVDLKYLAELIAKNDVDTVVFGLPLNMDGSIGIRVEKTQEFAEKLGKLISAKIEFIDERLTSVEAQEIILQTVPSRKKRQDKGLIDKISATIILQNYLDKL